MELKILGSLYQLIQINRLEELQMHDILMDLKTSQRVPMLPLSSNLVASSSCERPHALEAFVVLVHDVHSVDLQ